MHRAMYFEKMAGDRVKCNLCPRECVVKPGQRGFCRAKENRGGELYSTLYEELTSLALDPIEKKPLYHFYPGSDILSIGTVGCNLRCKFCQNWHIAHVDAPTRRVKIDDLIVEALRNQAIGIAYTYSEPLIWYEFILEASKKVHDAGLKNVIVTNGLIHRNPLKELLEFIDGVNLDIKGFTDDFYENICAGKYLEYIKETAEIISERCHLEVTTLLIPGLNDSIDELEDLAFWLAKLNSDIPYHITRYFPNYQLDIQPTSVELLHKAKEIAEQYLNYVYLGNLTEAERTTYCPQCKYPVVERSWFVENRLKERHCPKCGYDIDILYEY